MLPLLLTTWLAATAAEPPRAQSEPPTTQAEPPARAATPQAAAATATPAPTYRRVALVPFENLSSASAGREGFRAPLLAGLAARGYEVVSGEAVETFLEARRIRYLDSLLPEQLEGLLAATGAEAALLGTIIAFQKGEGTNGAALALRLVARDGTVLWCGVRSITPLDTVGLLGLGRTEAPDALAARVVASLLETLPPRAALGLGLAAPPRARRGGLRIYRDPSLTGRPLTLCVLPMQNYTEAKEAPRALDTVLLQRLSQERGLTIISPAELRHALVKLGLRAPSQLGPDQVAALAAELDTPYVLQPTLLAYGAGETDQGEGTLEVELHLLLVDTVRGRVAWSGQGRRLASEYRGLFGRGPPNDTLSLSSRLVAELVEAFRH